MIEEGTMPEQIRILSKRCLLLEQENKILRDLLTAHQIPIPTIINDQIQEIEKQETPSVQSSSMPNNSDGLSKSSPLADRIHLFMSLFHGREDVYARYWENKRNGKKGYSPVCRNSWVPGVCPLPQKKCQQCSHPDYEPYTPGAVERHLSKQHKDILGIYAIQPDDSCWFLAIDLDEENWFKDVQAIREICKTNQISCSTEKSRSGNGAHIWFFFSEPIPASTARRMGSSIITSAMKTNAKLSFSSYDRMFPNQDTLPKGGFGNLIALPLQPEAALSCGGSLFIDEQGTVYPDQWAYLSSVSRMSLQDVEAAISRIGLPALGALIPEDETEKPWNRRNPEFLSPTDPTTILQCVIADQIYISTRDVSNAAQNGLKRLAAFRNPEYFQKQALHKPVWNTPRVICCAEYDGDYLCLPRGCAEDINRWAEQNNISVEWQDEQSIGKEIHVNFIGSLYTEQQIAFEMMIRHDKGVLSATTAFGKTVVAAAMIAYRKRTTLILVHRKQLLDQWKERLEDFLDIQEELPDLTKKKGRKKQHSVIGQYGSGKDRRSGIIDIAMIQSVEQKGEVPVWVGEYGLVIVDECHHVPAVSFEAVLRKIRAKYSFGLTATPKRKDGHHPMIPMYLGPIRYRVDARQQAAQRPFTHIMIPRFTGTVFQQMENSEPAGISAYYSQIAEDEIRNHMIADDVFSCLKEGRNCLVLSERVAHVQILADLIRKEFADVFVLVGGQTNSESSSMLQKIRSFPAEKPLVICATGKYIGEGFDESRLDTLLLAMPVSWEGILAQYAGRLHRLYHGKTEVRVYDYIDDQAVMLERMYHKRLKTYASLGYHVCAERSDTALSNDIIYDQKTFVEPFLHDVRNAKKSVLIVSPFAKQKRINWLFQAVKVNPHPIRVSVVTRPPDSFQGQSSIDASKAIQFLKDHQAAVVCKPSIHQKFAVIDEKIIWYGSINLLSFGASQESIIRIVTGSVARTLLQSIT